ncbi:hypothetical protein L208DRAFT_1397584 [Tricholoma matsutake]|nr:hypothetical protein L208DRAFT_1397584 [Tricholoma matsutake 945]
MAGQKRCKLTQILNLGNWAGKKKIKLSNKSNTEKENVNPNSKWQTSIGRAVSIISSITESVFGKTGDSGTEEHEARDDRSMLTVTSMAPLQLLSAFVPINEGVVPAIETHINDNALNGDPEARHDTETPRSENWNNDTQGDSESITQTGAPEDESDNESDAGEGKHKLTLILILISL